MPYPAPPAQALGALLGQSMAPAAGSSKCCWSQEAQVCLEPQSVGGGSCGRSAGEAGAPEGSRGAPLALPALPRARGSLLF